MAAKIKLPAMTQKQLLEKLRHNSIKVTPLIELALIQAKETHGNIKRLNGTPYLEQHIYPMVSDMIDYCKYSKKNIDDVIIASVLLHDVMEDDPKITPTIFKKMFGKKVFDTVMPVTKPVHDPNVSQQEMFKINQRFWKSIKKSGEYSIIIKLIDKINNNSCDFGILPEHADKVRRDVNEIEKMYMPYAIENYEYFYKKFKTLAQELNKALKSKPI